MNPFDELTKGVSGKPFWLTGKLWLSLISFLKRDRIIVGMGCGITELPTPTGRVISLDSASANGAGKIEDIYIVLNGTRYLTNIITDGRLDAA